MRIFWAAAARVVVHVVVPVLDNEAAGVGGKAAATAEAPCGSGRPPRVVAQELDIPVTSQVISFVNNLNFELKLWK